MAFVIAAAVTGLVAGGGISAMTSWLTGGSHDTVEKGAQVLYTDSVYLLDDGTVNVVNKFKVVKDSSTNLVKLPETLPWEADVILVICFSGLIIHFLGALWGFLSGKCHTLMATKHRKVKQDLEHGSAINEMKTALSNEKEKRAALEEIHAHHRGKMYRLKKYLRKMKDGHDTERRTDWESESDSGPEPPSRNRSASMKRKSTKAWEEHERQPGRLAITYHQDAAAALGTKKKKKTVRDWLEEQDATDGDF